MPRDITQKLYDLYFTPRSRGYAFIRNFHAKYHSDLAGTELSNFDAFLNHIYLSLTTIDFEGIEGPEENYIIKAMYYQCWNTIYTLKKERQWMVPDSATAVSSDEGTGETAVERKASDDPGPADYLEASDLFALIQTFKWTLKNEDRRILNALIDQKSLQETADAMRMEYNALNVKLKRLREKLAVFLKRTGYQNDVTGIFLRKIRKKM